MTALRLTGFYAVLVLAIFPGAPLQWFLRRGGFFRAADRLQVLAAKNLCRALRLSVHAHGILPADRPILVVANHVSWTDILAFASQAPLCFLAKADVLGWPLLGPAVRAYGTLFVSRRRTRAFGAVNAEIAAKLAQGGAVVLFAEGTTGNGSRLEPFRSGHLAAADLLLAAARDVESLAIVPATIAYTGAGGLPASYRDRTEIAWIGDTPLLPHLPTLMRHGPIRCDLVWGEPMAFLPASDRKAATATLRAYIRANFSRLVRGERPGGGGGEPVQTARSTVWSKPSMPAAPRQISSPGSPS